MAREEDLWCPASALEPDDDHERVPGAMFED